MAKLRHCCFHVIRFTAGFVQKRPHNTVTRRRLLFLLHSVSDDTYFTLPLYSYDVASVWRLSCFNVNLSSQGIPRFNTLRPGNWFRVVWPLHLVRRKCQHVIHYIRCDVSVPIQFQKATLHVLEEIPLLHSSWASYCDTTVTSRTDKVPLPNAGRPIRPAYGGKTITAGMGETWLCKSGLTHSWRYNHYV
jgi:hypothetical protein